MKFNTSSETWNRGVTAVQGAVGGAISNPILDNILVEVSDNRVSYTATNLSVTIRCQGEASVERQGSIVLPAKIITPLAQSLPDADVEFDEVDSSVKIHCARFNASLKGQDAALFPPFNKVEEGITFNLSVERLKNIIRKTIFATSAEKSRYELDGVKFHASDGVMNFISTDGRRLSIYTLKENVPNYDISALVPTKTLQVVNNSLPDEGDVEVRIHERKIQFSCADVIVVSNLLIDNFPQYDRIIPEPGEVNIVINRANIISSIRRASNLTSHDTNLMILRFSSEGLEVLGESEEIGGTGQDQIDIDYSGEILEVRYNYRFLMDALRVMDEENININIGDPRKPGIFTGIGDENYRYVLMPLRPPERREDEE